MQWRAPAAGIVLAALLGPMAVPATAQAALVRGTPGPDVLSDTGRGDVIRAKAGADDIYMMRNRDRRRDPVLCGSGFDQVFVNYGPDMRGRPDRRDSFRSCEQIRAYSRRRQAGPALVGDSLLHG
jgi:hypothetical protein